MADVRSLLRQQRAARRIDHPHASYTDSGKLSCTFCHGVIKSEALWEGHIRSTGHRQRLLSYQNTAPRQQQAQATKAGGCASRPGKSSLCGGSTDTPSDEALLASIIAGGRDAGGRKRQRGEADSDVEMSGAETTEDAIRRKRSKQQQQQQQQQQQDSVDSPTAASALMPAPTCSNGSKDWLMDARPDRGTPTTTPSGLLLGRISSTPVQGVEMQIPSRPATPSASTPSGRNSLTVQESRAAFATSSRGSLRPTETTSISTSTSTTTAATDDDDAEWAAFEAEVVNAPAPSQPNTTADGQPVTTAAAKYSPSDAVISAVPLTAEQIAARSAEQERAPRRAVGDIQLEDETEEARRAMETEFEEMEELEARVRKLKEKREAIRRGITSATNPFVASGEVLWPSGNVANGHKPYDNDGDDDDDDDDDDSDGDWSGFRIRS